MSDAPRADSWRLAPVDAPSAPRKGMKLWVQTGTYWFEGDGYTISRVNSQSFYVSRDGETTRYPLIDWHTFLSAREREGEVDVDGHPMRKLRAAPISDAFECARATGSGATGARGRRRGLRDARILRAVRDVLKSYKIDETTNGSGALSGGARRFQLRQGGAGRPGYTIEVDPEWRARPSCDCPDARERLAAEEDAVFCKHIVAVLLQKEELRHQLIDLFL